MLTDKQIRGLKPRDKEYIASDDDRSRGTGRLVIRVRPSGTKTWEYRYFVAGKRRKKTLGTYPEVSLVQARRAVSEIAEDRAARRAGGLPEGRSTRGLLGGQSTVTPGSLGELLEAYVADLERRNKSSAPEVEAGFRRWIEGPFPGLWETRADLVTPADIRDLLAHHIERGVTTSVNRLRAYLHAAYRFGLTNENNPMVSGTRGWGLSVNPVGAVPRQPSFERAGNRVLAGADVAHVWHHITATPGVGWRFAKLIQLAIATAGQRPSMLLRLRVQDVDMVHQVLDIPGESTKTERPHVVPLGDHARPIIELLVGHARVSRTEVLFPASRGKGGVGRINSASSALAMYREFWGAPEWTLRDVRRTAKTVLAQQKVPKAHRDRLHGHALTDVADQHYDRYDYLEEKAAAMAVWDAWLSATLRGTADLPKYGSPGTADLPK